MTMTEPRPRRFTTLDAMTLVAAVAFALVPASWPLASLGRWLGRVSWHRLDDPAYRDTLLHQTAIARGIIGGVAELAILALVALTVVLVVLWVLPPRQPLRDLARRPGLWACVTAVAGMGAFAWVRPLGPILIPGAVGTAWLILAATGRWVAESSWLDRAGRAVGVCWLATLPLMVWLR